MLNPKLVANGLGKSNPSSPGKCTIDAIYPHGINIEASIFLSPTGLPSLKTGLEMMAYMPKDHIHHSQLF